MSRKKATDPLSKTAKAVRPLVVDWRKYMDVNNRGEFVMDITGVSDKQKGWYIPWTHDEYAGVESQLTIFTNIPIKCRGHECPFADSCPLVEHNVVERAVGHNCPVEIVDAFRYFSGYVRELGVGPNDFTDIQMINDLVRLHIMIDRCDKLLQKENPIDVIIEGVDAKTGLAHRNPVPSALVRQQNILRKDKDTLYQRLLASREAKEQNRARKGTSTSTVDLLSKIYDRLSKEEQQYNIDSAKSTNSELHNPVTERLSRIDYDEY